MRKVYSYPADASPAPNEYDPFSVGRSRQSAGVADYVREPLRLRGERVSAWIPDLAPYVNARLELPVRLQLDQDGVVRLEKNLRLLGRRGRNARRTVVAAVRAT